MEKKCARGGGGRGEKKASVESSSKGGRRKGKKKKKEKREREMKLRWGGQREEIGGEPERKEWEWGRAIWDKSN